MVPGEYRHGSPMRRPGFRAHAYVFFGRTLCQPEEIADADLDCKITGRPDIGTALRKQQVDFR